jgi:hypothetical protein
MNSTEYVSNLEYLSFKANTDLSNKLVDLEVKALDEDHYHLYTLTYEELVELVDNKKFLFGYCNHILRNNGSYIEHFNVELPMKTTGEVTSKYIRFNFTPFIRKLMLRAICNHYKKLEFDSAYSEANKYNRVDFRIDNKRLTRWDKLYTQGSGGVDLLISEESQALLNMAIAADKSGTLKRAIDQKFQMAKNQTYAFWEKGKLKLSAYGSLESGEIPQEFNFWCAGMYGGIINHDPDGKGDWCSHT